MDLTSFENPMPSPPRSNTGPGQVAALNPRLRARLLASVQKVEEVTTRQHRIAQLALTGLQHKQIAQILNVSPTTVTTVLKSPVISKYMLAMRGYNDMKSLDVRHRIDELQSEALEQLTAVLGSDANEEHSQNKISLLRLKTDVAKHVLAINGVSPVKKQETRNLSMLITPQDVNDIKEAAMKLKGGPIVQSV